MAFLSIKAPHTHTAILCTANKHQSLSVGVEAHAKHQGRVTGERVCSITAGNIPHLNEMNREKCGLVQAQDGAYDMFANPNVDCAVVAMRNEQMC